MNLKDVFSKAGKGERKIRPLKTKVPMSKYKKRQYALAGSVLIGFSAVAMFGAYQFEAKKKEKLELAQEAPSNKAIEKTNMTSPSQILDGSAVWQQSYGANQDAQQQEIRKLNEELRSLKSGKEMLGGQPNLAMANLPPPPSNLMVNPGQIPNGSNLNKKPEFEDASRIESITFGSGGRSGNLAVIPGDTGKTGYIRGVKPNLVVTSDGGDVTYLNSSKSSTSKFNELNSTGKFRAQKSYIPTGTFFRAVLLGGLDAPTGGESQNANPHPVLMEITNLAQLPNSVRMNFKKCFVTGTGYGDLSSERAMIRTEQMSCVGTDGRALDIPIKGWVAGDDGKTGVRGRLVSKQGAVLKNALIAGTLSGIGSALSAGATTTTTNGLGSVASISTGKQAQNALGAGANSAFDRLAQYYVKLADKMFPVIEVDAGRTVDIVLLKGFQIGDE